MFGVNGHERDDSYQASRNQQGGQSRHWSTPEECARIRIIARHGIKLTGPVCAQLVVGHRAE
jgi:hypothetical protein